MLSRRLAFFGRDDGDEVVTFRLVKERLSCELIVFVRFGVEGVVVVVCERRVVEALGVAIVDESGSGGGGGGVESIREEYCCEGVVRSGLLRLVADVIADWLVEAPYFTKRNSYKSDANCALLYSSSSDGSVRI